MNEIKKNNRIRVFIENLSYTFSANLLKLLISAITILLLPKFLGVAEYGYYQLYLLYFSYVGIIQMGWADGVYLRYGGKDYSNLNKRKIGSQFWLLSIFYTILAILIYVLLINMFPEEIYPDLLFYTLVSGFLSTPSGLLHYILQATNRIKEFGKLVIIDRLVYFTALLIFLFFGVNRYEIVILSDLAGKGVSFLMTAYLCKDIVFIKIISFSSVVKESYINISSGFKLMVANFASTLIIGIIRINIENKWGIEEFSKVSLTMSISNLFMVFINSVALVIFPQLRRTAVSNLGQLYRMIRTVLMIPLLFTLTFYHPINSILSVWLPQYADGLKYMALLFPIIVFESKMALLVNTYLKTLRKEKKLLLINVVTVILSISTTYFTVYILGNFNLTILSIIFLLAFRSTVSEIYISSILGISVIKDIILELLLTIIFILVSWYIGEWTGTFIYLVSFMVYISLNKSEIKNTISYIKENIR